ncbi:MAG: 4Fe-4S binding protein [Methanospirillum sp.]
MKIHTVKLVCFSPTGTSKAVVRAIAEGIGHDRTDLLDITAPEARERPLRAAADELLVVAVPVYMGRVPAVLDDWLAAVEAAGTPTVCVAVYGNRVYEDALLELRDRLAAAGCRPIAGAAYIGEHSFSRAGTPTAAGRPDAGDLAHAESFGRAIREKLLAAPSADAIPEAALPGCRPYRGDPTLWLVDFIEVGDGCTHCGVCAAVCPVGAIDPDDSARVETARCITCCACIKRCPAGARTMKPGLVMDASVRLHTLYGERKEPEIFL